MQRKNQTNKRFTKNQKSFIIKNFIKTPFVEKKTKKLYHKITKKEKDNLKTQGYLFLFLLFYDKAFWFFSLRRGS